MMDVASERWSFANLAAQDRRVLFDDLRTGGGRWLSRMALSIDDVQLDRRDTAPGDVFSRRTYVIRGDEVAPVGFVRVETTGDGLGFVTLYVTTWARRRGAGVAGLRHVAGLDDIVALEAVVHPDNEPALRCCARAGFATDGRRHGDLLVLGRMGRHHQD